MTRACRRLLALGLIVAAAIYATIVPRLSFEKLVGESEIIVHGQVVSSWTAWDRGGHYIWTHHALRVDDAIKGSAREIVVSEPGGVVGNVGMQVPGAVRFAPGEEVILFLYRTPVGYMRTTGWSQGKFDVVRDPASGRKILRNRIEGITLTSAVKQTAIETLQGSTVEDVKTRIREMLRGIPPREVR